METGNHRQRCNISDTVVDWKANVIARNRANPDRELVTVNETRLNWYDEQVNKYYVRLDGKQKIDVGLDK